MYVELKGIGKQFKKSLVVSDVNFCIEKGKIVALLGPSGSGKTTILRMIAGLENPSSGDIFLDGNRVNNLHPRDRKIGFVFQSYALFRYMNVQDNIAFGLEMKKFKKTEIKKRVDDLLELTGLKEYAKSYPNELSGGQRQRVAFARAIATDPALLLLDEPFAALDIKVRRELRTWLRGTIHQLGITSIFVTHDQEEAVEVADEIIVMSKGKIEQVGSPIEVYKKPATPFVAKFIGLSSTVKCFDSLKGFAEYKGEYEGAVIRPEFIEAFKPDNLDFKEMIDCTDEGVVTDISFRGNSLEIKLKVGDIELVTRRSLERREVKINEKMRVLVFRVFAFDKSNVYLLENSELSKKYIHSKQLEANLYGADGYFVG